MIRIVSALALICSFHSVSGRLSYAATLNVDKMGEYIAPTVFIPVFVSKAHSLPYFLGGIERLSYPKNRIRIWFVTDHNNDQSLELIKSWTNAWEGEYDQIRLEVRDPRKGRYDDAHSELAWTPKRYEHTLKLKQEAIERARRMWADYIFYIDADNILLEESMLHTLMHRNKTVIGPMLETSVAFSNFWMAQNEETGYYERGDDYYDIRDYHKKSVYQVPMLHSCYLIDLNRYKSKSIQFWPRIKEYSIDLPLWPKDDVIYFTGMAKLRNIDLWVDNTMAAGWFPYPVQSGHLQLDVEMFNHMMMEMSTLPPVGWNRIAPASAAAPPIWPTPFKTGVTKIKMISLERRKDRRDRMDFCMRIQGLDYDYVPAVDGKKLTQKDIDDMGIRQLPGFSDPHHPRTVTRGEVGCFLSHYRIWEEMKPGDIYLILEDDVRFGTSFVNDLKQIIDEAKNIKSGWDLIYVGRKRGPGAADDEEYMVTEHISSVTYSFWTIGYLLTGNAAQKLIREKPLEKLVPVDEYLPIMYGAHKEEKYNRHFKSKNLRAFSAQPVLIRPTHFTGQENYFTDTEPASDDDILFKDEL